MEDICAVYRHTSTRVNFYLALTAIRPYVRIWECPEAFWPRPWKINDTINVLGESRSPQWASFLTWHFLLQNMCSSPWPSAAWVCAPVKLTHVPLISWNMRPCVPQICLIRALKCALQRQHIIRSCSFNIYEKEMQFYWRETHLEIVCGYIWLNPEEAWEEGFIICGLNLTCPNCPLIGFRRFSNSLKLQAEFAANNIFYIFLRVGVSFVT